jgi:hypothetical protein
MTAEQVRGRTRVSERALVTLAQAIAATSLGVPAGKVRASLDDHDGVLAAEISAPVAIGGGSTVLDQIGEAQQAVRSRLPDLTQRVVGPVRFRMTSAIPERKARVR